jgi:zinc transport system substrate-binding protein
MRIVLTAATTAVTVALALAAGSCGGGDDVGAAPEGGRDVVASFYPLAFAAKSVGGDAVSVHDLTPPGAEPHDLELSVRDLARVRSADTVLYLGRGFQPAVEEAAVEAEGETLDVLALLGVGGDDPHVWLDPELYARVARAVAGSLGDEDAARPLVARLERLDRELARGLADCERREIVASHAAFGHLAAAYDLEQIAIAGLSPEAQPTPGDLERISRLVRERGVTTVFVEPLAPRAEAETIARETGVEVATLDPIEGLSRERLDRGDDYFSVMRANLAALRQGLGCR